MQSSKKWMSQGITMSHWAATPYLLVTGGVASEEGEVTE